MNNIIQGLIWFVLAVSTAASSLLGLFLYSESVNMREDLSSTRAAISSPAMLWYGTVSSVDAGTRSFEAEFLDKYHTGETFKARIYISTDALLARQELLKDGEFYVGSKPVVSEGIEGLKPGMRISVSVPENNSYPEKLVSRAVIFGDPL